MKIQAYRLRPLVVLPFRPLAYPSFQGCGMAAKAADHPSGGLPIIIVPLLPLSSLPPPPPLLLLLLFFFDPRRQPSAISHQPAATGRSREIINGFLLPFAL
jgi:hypothetical protein